MLTEAMPVEDDVKATGEGGGRQPHAVSRSAEAAPPVWTFGGRMLARAAEVGRGTHRRYAEAAERALNTCDAMSRRSRLDARAIALKSQIAVDRNVKAYFDCVEDVAQAASLRDAARLQLSFFWDQCRRSADQMSELQRMTLDSWRKTTAARVG